LSLCTLSVLIILHRQIKERNLIGFGTYLTTQVSQEEICLTSFGHAVVNTIRPVLESSEPIRWKKYLPKLLEPGSHLLQGFDRFKSALLDSAEGTGSERFGISLFEDEDRRKPE